MWKIKKVLYNNKEQLRQARLIISMGSAASTISAEQFQSVKSLYESKKAEGLSDEELFNQIKAVLDHPHTTAAVVTVVAAVVVEEEVQQQQPTVVVSIEAAHVEHTKPEESAASIEQQHVLPPKSPRLEDAPVLVSVDAHPEPPVELVMA